MTPQRNNRTLIWALTLAVSGVLAGSERPLAVTRAPEWTAVFERTAGWLGADGIYSIPLNGYDAAIGPRSVSKIHTARSLRANSSGTFSAVVWLTENRRPGT